MSDSRIGRGSQCPAISVLMPVYNAGRYLAEAVESILHQTFEDFEFIIINDGSTDGSLALLERYAAQDGRIRLISRENRGLVPTRNELLEASHGEYVAWMDSDDISRGDRLQKLVAYLAGRPEVAAVGSSVLMMDSEGWPIRVATNSTDHDSIDGGHIKGQGGQIAFASSMMRRVHIIEEGGFQGHLSGAEDLDLLLRLAERWRLSNLTEVLYEYRQHVDSACHAKQEAVRRDTLQVVRAAWARRGLDPSQFQPHEKGTSAQAPARHNVKWAWWALGAGNIATARKHARRAVFRCPWSLASWRVLYCALRGH